MSILGWFAKRKKSKGYQFDDTDRELSAQKRMLNSQLRQKRQIIELRKLQQELDDIESEMYPDMEGEEDDDTETVLMKSLLVPLLQNLNTPVAGTSPSVQPTEEVPQQEVISDDVLRAMIKKIPKQYLRLAKKLDDNELYHMIHGKFPGYDLFTINRAIKIFREENT